MVRALAGCCAAQLALALLVIPPWQNPDEPQHVHTVRLIRQYGSDYVPGGHQNDSSEQAIVESMARHGWWQLYGAATPNPVPATFAAGPAQLTRGYFGAPSGGSRAYYRAAAAVFRATGTDDPVRQLNILRSLSALWAMLTMACIWASMRTLFGRHAALALVAVAALHPQFVIVATTASPDAFVNLAGAVVWWQSALLITSPVRLRAVAVLMMASVVALLTRRLGAVLIPIAAAVTLIAAARALPTMPLRRIVWTTGICVVAFAVMGTIWSAVPDLNRAIAWLQFDPARAAASVAADPVELATFFERFYTSWWLTAGWMRYAAPGWWYAVTALISVVALAGVVVTYGRRGAVRRSLELKLVALAAGMLAVQAVAAVAYQLGVLQSGAQGRYLFPVFPAALCLMWVGWKALIGREGHESLAAVALVAVFGFLNVTAWAFVLLPVYM